MTTADGSGHTIGASRQHLRRGPARQALRIHHAASESWEDYARRKATLVHKCITRADCDNEVSATWRLSATQCMLDIYYDMTAQEPEMLSRSGPGS